MEKEWRGVFREGPLMKIRVNRGLWEVNGSQTCTINAAELGSHILSIKEQPFQREVCTNVQFNVSY